MEGIPCPSCGSIETVTLRPALQKCTKCLRKFRLIEHVDPPGTPNEEPDNSITANLYSRAPSVRKSATASEILSDYRASLHLSEEKKNGVDELERLLEFAMRKMSAAKSTEKKDDWRQVLKYLSRDLKQAKRRVSADRLKAENDRLFRDVPALRQLAIDYYLNDEREINRKMKANRPESGVQ